MKRQVTMRGARASRARTGAMVILAACGASSAQGGVATLFGDSYSVTVGGQQFQVIDLYLVFAQSDYRLFNVYNTDVKLTGGGTWYHDDAAGTCSFGGTWAPIDGLSFSPVDSFVTIGLQTPGGANEAQLDPFFDDTPACSSYLGDDAGWYAADHFSGQGLAADLILYDGSVLESSAMIGRFAMLDSGAGQAFLSISKMSIIYAPGGTVPFQYSGLSGEFAYVPAPPSLIGLVLLRAASATGRRRAC